MGCVSSKKKLSKADLEFLEENTEFTKDQIVEWYEGFIVSEQFSEQIFFLHRRRDWGRFLAMRSSIHQTIIWFIGTMKLLFLRDPRGDESVSQSRLMFRRIEDLFTFVARNLSIFYSSYRWCQKTTTTRITTSVWSSTSIEWVHTDIVCCWRSGPSSFLLIDHWWRRKERSFIQTNKCWR